MLSYLPVIAAAWVASDPLGAFRPPAVPLVTHDPYFSVWSMNDRLTDNWSRHWTGATQALCGIARIDGKAYRFAGPYPERTPAMTQQHLEVTPTRTTYLFEAGGIRLALTFLSPLLPHDLKVLSRPVTYVIWEAQSVDGQPHSVEIYLDVTAEWVVDTPNQAVVWRRYALDGMSVMRCGTRGQPVLGKSGDNVRIDWGYLYVAVPDASRARTVIAADRAARDGFISGQMPAQDDPDMPRIASHRWPVLATALDLGTVGAEPVRRYLMLAYDDEYSIEYLYTRLRPYWRRGGMTADRLLRTAQKDYERLQQACARFDDELMQDLRRVGGEHYARLCALAFRQCLAAHKLVASPRGEPWFFSKENFSNGCIATVDVTYPSAPFFLLFNPTLLRGMLTPVLEYAQTPRWKFPFAPHDLGTYPLANGQVYGGGEQSEENQMPVEECGNMLLMVAALAEIEDDARYAARFWPLLQRWAEYLRDRGMDPENQLCTDDFAGHLAHNANLSLKAILALGGYAQLCQRLGRTEEARQYRETAQQMARQWIAMADDGDHYRLTFDRPGTWSQKYNLVWDRLLNLNLFPPEVARKEIAYYKKVQNAFGLPLDNRSQYTKLDWIVWSATLAETQADFEELIAPVYAFAHTSPSRVPLTDWYWTHDAKQTGFQARSVVGGIFIRMLADRDLWRKWASRAQ
ncbi:MAG: DUF4965 domain-containing protein [Chthonomonadaceae bacterium]|nr:DUF4965 domain-containing protein [Chthonomonadaceae bacterium]